MLYQSTRGKAARLGFRQTVLEGLAKDGGLYVPTEWQVIAPEKITSLAGKKYEDFAFEIISRFTGGDIPENDLRKLIDETYRNFHHSAVAPLVQISEREWVLELFHGETLAFKDFALQFLGRLFDYFLKAESKKINIVGATSGDTGSAAIAGCRGRGNMNIFILHPKGRVSDVQRLMMTTVPDENVFNIAIEGTFDDCQNIVKALFGDLETKEKYGLTAINSINWARILAQVVYYFYAAVNLGAPFKKMTFAVPTGNFGDIYAGFIARMIGLPIESLIIGTNQNDILHRCQTTGEYKITEVIASQSPSIDIQIASNFERVLFEFYGRDSNTICNKMEELRTTGVFKVEDKALAQLKSAFKSGRVSEAETAATIAEVYKSSGYLADPHTAVGIKAGRGELANTESPHIYLATAHAAKFPESVEKAAGVKPQLPAHVKDLFSQKERMVVLPNDVAKVKEYISKNALK